MGEVKGVACCDRCGVAIPGVPAGKGIRVFCPECGRVKAAEAGPIATGFEIDQKSILPTALRAVAIFNFLAAFVGILALMHEVWGLWTFIWAVAFGQAGLFWLAMAALMEAGGRNGRK